MAGRSSMFQPKGSSARSSSVSMGYRGRRRSLRRGCSAKTVAEVCCPRGGVAGEENGAGGSSSTGRRRVRECSVGGQFSSGRCGGAEGGGNGDVEEVSARVAR